MSLVLDGTNGVTFNNSTTQASAGSVLQVVSYPFSTQYSTTSSTFVSTGVAASITPKFSTSKILLTCSSYVRTSASGVSCTATIYRGATNILASTSIGALYIYSSAAALELTAPIYYLDSPATTSSTTYTIYIKNQDSAGTAYFGNGSFTSQLTLMEIAA